jgi:hypothetical protein
MTAHFAHCHDCNTPGECTALGRCYFRPPVTPPRQKPTFELHAEAACCIWEALLEIKDHDDCAPESVRSAIVSCFHMKGTAEMRHAAIALSVLCCDVHDLMPEDERPIPYDWEFVPAFVCSLTWGWQHSRCVEIPDAETALRRLREYILQRDCDHHQDDGRGRCRHCGVAR